MKWAAAILGAILGAIKAFYASKPELVKERIPAEDDDMDRARERARSRTTPKP